MKQYVSPQSSDDQTQTSDSESPKRRIVSCKQYHLILIVII